MVAISSTSPPRVTSSSAATSITTASFTPPAGYLVACVSVDVTSGTIATLGVSNNGTALTWTKVIEKTQSGNTSSTQIAYFIARLTASRALTVTGTTSSSNEISLKVWAATDVDTTTPTGATNSGTTTANSINMALTPTAAGSIGFYGAIQDDVVSAAPTSSDSNFDGFFVSGQIGGGGGWKTLGASGAAVNYNIDGPGTGSIEWNWCAFELRNAPATGGVPIVNAGADVASHTVSTAFTRTATEDPNGSTITSRSWTINSGPAGVGTTIGTAAALSWTPSTTGTYVLRYTATNSSGTSTPDDMSITVVAPAAAIWVGDAETNDFSAMDSPGSLDIMSPQTRAIVTSPVRAGTYAYEHDINGTASNGSQRSESVPSLRYLVENDDLWFAFSTYLPSGFPTAPDDFQLVWQWKNDGTGSPPLELNCGSYSSGLWQIRGGFGHPSGDRTMTPQDMGSVVTGQWDDWLFHIVFSSNTAVGYIEGWRNGVKQFGPYYPPGGTMYPGAQSYVKMGLYRGGGLPVTTSTRIYHDEARAGTTRSSVELTAASPPSVSAGADATLTLAQGIFNRTATESGSAATSRSWTILSGPANVGATLSTTTTVSWVPPVRGTYVLRYTASNSSGSGVSDITVTVNAPALPDYIRDISIGYANTSSFTVPKPPLVEADDKMVAMCITDYVSATSTEFTRDTAAGISNYDTAMNVFRRTASASEPDNYTFGIGASTSATVAIVVFKKDHIQAAWDVAPTVENSTSTAAATTSPVSASLSPTSPTPVLVLGYGTQEATSGLGPHTPPTGMTEIVDFQSPYPGRGLLMVVQEVAPGATGTKTATATGTATNYIVSAGALQKVPYPPPEVDAGVDEMIVVNEPHSRTAIETGQSITSRRWTLVSAPETTSLRPTSAKYRYYRFDPTAIRGGAGEPNMQISEFELRAASARVSGMTVTVEGTNNSPTGEEPSKAADNSVTTKWLNLGNSTSASLIYDFGTATTIDSYRLATGNDYDVRDPISWVISGSHDGVNWDTLDTKTSYAVPTARQTYTPSIPLSSIPISGAVLSETATINWTPDVVGTFVLRYTATNASGSDFDDASFTVVQAPAPTVDAGADTTIVNREQFTRVAGETGDYISSREWRVTSGPAEVNAVLSTTATLTWTPEVHGTYVLSYTATNPGGSATDNFTLTVVPVVTSISGTASASSSNTGTKLARRTFSTVQTASGASSVPSSALQAVAKVAGIAAAETTVPSIGLRSVRYIAGDAVNISSSVPVDNLVGLRLIAGETTAVSMAEGFISEPYWGKASAVATMTGTLVSIYRTSATLTGTTSHPVAQLITVTNSGSHTLTGASQVSQPNLGRLKYMSGRAAGESAVTPPTQRVVTGLNGNLVGESALSPAHLISTTRLSRTITAIARAGQRGRTAVITTATARSYTPTERARSVVSLSGYVTALTTATGDLVPTDVWHPAFARSTMSGNLVSLAVLSETVEADSLARAIRGLRRVAVLSTVLGTVEDDELVFAAPRPSEAPPPPVYSRTFTRLR